MPVKVENATEVAAALEALPGEIVARGFQSALHAGGEVLMGAIGARTPSDPDATSAKDGVALKSALHVEVELYAEGGMAKVGFGEKSYVANFVEYGHWQVGHGGSKESRTIEGVVAPHPFMRPAAAVAADAAVEVFEETLMDLLNLDK